MAYRDDLTALSARRDALVREVADSSDALDEASRALDHAHGRARLPVLDNIRVAEPCTTDWGRMTGSERVRHCGDCKKNVYNLSGMTRAEAEALIVEHNGALCVRYYQRPDGTILLADCEVGGARRRRRRHLIAIGAASLAAAGAATAYFALKVSAPIVGELPAQVDYTRVELPQFKPITLPEQHEPPPSSPPHDLVMGRISIAMPPKPVPTTPPAPMHVKMGKIAIHRGE